MLREAADPRLLDAIDRKFEDIFDRLDEIFRRAACVR